MKKKFNVTMDEEAVKVRRPWLKENGLTLSGDLNAQVKDTLKVMEIIGKTESVKDVTLNQLFQVYAEMAKEAQEKKGKEK